MGPIAREMVEGRAGTDHSLRAERAISGSSQLESLTGRRLLDDLIERDRLAADNRLWKFRDGADSLLASERSSSGDTCTIERAEADEHTKAERRDMDALLERERDRADADLHSERRAQDSAQVRIAARRVDTNTQLVMERRRADETLTALKESQASLAHARDNQGHVQDVLAMVTHDLRSPLSVIAANAQHMARDCAESSMREVAEDVVRAAARMERLLIDLADAARINSGTLLVVKTPHDACLLVMEILHSYEPLFASRGMTFSVELPVGSAFAPFDYDRIVQVLSNLLGNALKFTPSSEGVVTLQVRRQPDAIEFVVRDNGPGIAPADLPHVFEKFWKIDSDARRGLGLGLHICQSIVEAHGGHIHAESTLGEGAAFSFTLPVVRAPSPG